MELVHTLSDDEKSISYVSYAPNGDIKIEEDKYYLMYMNYNPDYDKYVISFVEYGLTEVINPDCLNDLDNVKILNNVTKDEEKLYDYIGKIEIRLPQSHWL